jgi:uncharacterized protein involved in outer membrane biogenesis
MARKVLLVSFGVVLILTVGLFLVVRTVFATDAVRTTLSQQLSHALGQPVTVGDISAGLYPRVTVNLRDVTIGEPTRIRVRTLHVGTDFWALFSRRIEHARLELSGARVELPLPQFTIGDSTTSETPNRAPVELGSIDAITLSDVEIVSGGRTVIGDVDIVPDGKGATLRKVNLRAGDAKIAITGRIADRSGPVGELTIKAGALNFDQMLAFVSDFASGASVSAAAPRAAPSRRATPRPGSAAPMNIAVSLAADRATIGTLTLDNLSGTARITPNLMSLTPITFGVFGGRYDGSLVFRLSAVPDFTLNASLAAIDVATATAFAGSPGTMTGKLSGKLTLGGHGLAAASILRSARGSARVDIADGTVKNLGLVRTIVVATSGRADGGGVNQGSRDEPFSRLGATLAIGGGVASTSDLRFESPNLLLGAAGTLRLDGSNIDLKGRVQLSDELSQRAGRDLVRYTQEGGRVTLPATITGSAESPHVQIDVADMAKRALANRATEEAQKALKKGLSGLFKR